MKLLIITQTVDTEDPVLGFFVRWIEEFVKHTDRIEVICLKEGKHSLPANVRVHSLGKSCSAQATQDTGARLRYAFRFLSLAWRLRRDYDAVFVHMNPEYVVLGGPFWRLSGKRIVFWYNHPQNDTRLQLAMFFANQVLYTSPYAATAHSKKTRQMPAGIDTNLFKSQSVVRAPLTVYMQGRVAPSKRVHILLEAIRILRARGVNATAAIVGPEDAAYGQKLRTDFADLIAARAVAFLGPKTNTETPALYGSHQVAVNLAADGHYDKTVLEAMACETPVIVSSKAFVGLVPTEWTVPENNSAVLAVAFEKVLGLPQNKYQALGVVLRQKVIGSQSLTLLSAQFAAELARKHKRPRLLRLLLWYKLYMLARFFPHAPRMTVLLYHSISDTADFFAVSPEQFDRQMLFLRTYFDVVPLARAFAHATGERVKRDSVAITFDDGYRDFATDVLPVLERYQIPATVFVFGNEPDRAELGNDHPLLTAADTALVTNPLVEVGSHTLSHKKLSKMPEDDARHELEDSQKEIEAKFGSYPQYLAYPKGSYNLSVQRLAKETGYKGAVSVVERSVHSGDEQYALPRIQVDSSTSFTEFRAKLSPAADWYYALWSLAKRLGGK